MPNVASKGSSTGISSSSIVLALLASTLLVSIPAFLSIHSNRQLGNSFKWVAHTLEVRRETQRLLTLLIDAETGSRGFLLSKQENFLEPYNAALGEIPLQIRHIQELTADNPIQQENLRQIDPLVKAKLEKMAKVISLQRSGNLEEVLALMQTGRGKQIMDQIRSRFDLMDSEEARLLRIRQEALGSGFKTNTALLFGLILLDGLFAGGMLMVFRRLQNVRNLVTVCAWSHKVEYENQWISFEEFLKRRFQINCSHGISPEEYRKMFGDTEEPVAASMKQ